MKTAFRTKLAFFIVGSFLAVGSGNMSAQTVTSGPDGNTRVLWKGTDGSVLTYIIDSNLDYVSSQTYGPYNGWEAVALATDDDNTSRLLWKNTDGSLTVWMLDANLNQTGVAGSYGPFAGWIPETISSSNGYTRLIWRNTNGSISIWLLDGNLNSLGSGVFTASFGWSTNGSASIQRSASPTNATTQKTPPVSSVPKGATGSH